MKPLTAQHDHEWLRIGSPEEQALPSVIRMNPNDGTWIVNIPFTLRCRYCGLRAAVVEEHRYGPRTNSLTIDDIRAERLLFPSHGGVSDNEQLEANLLRAEAERNIWRQRARRSIRPHRDVGKDIVFWPDDPTLSEIASEKDRMRSEEEQKA